MFTDIRFGTELLAGIAYLVSSMLLIKFACDMFFLERNDDVMSLKHTILSWLGGVPKSKIMFLEAERDYARKQVEEYKKDLVAAREVIEKLQAELNDMKQDKHIVDLFVRRETGDKVVINGQVIEDDCIQLLKGTPVTVAVYDKNDKLYPSLTMSDTEEPESHE
jgi:hypothetical protein